MWKKFRKRPVIVKAIYWDGTTETFIEIKKETDRIITAINDTLSIHTLEGIMTANKGDWIIKGIDNEVYPCKDFIFKATYDKVKE